MTANAIMIMVTGRYPTFRANSIRRPSPKLSRTTLRCSSPPETSLVVLPMLVPCPLSVLMHYPWTGNRTTTLTSSVTTSVLNSPNLGHRPSYELTSEVTRARMVTNSTLMAVTCPYYPA